MSVSRIRVELTGSQVEQLLHAVTAYLGDPDGLSRGERRALDNAGKELRQARARLLEKRMRAGLRP